MSKRIDIISQRYSDQKARRAIDHEEGPTFTKKGSKKCHDNNRLAYNNECQRQQYWMQEHEMRAIALFGGGKKNSGATRKTDPED